MRAVSPARQERCLISSSPDPDALDFGALAAIVGYHLRRASTVVSSDFARIFADTGMRQVPFGILALVAANPGTNQGAIGRALGIKRANMATLINELLAQGLVARESASDRRAFALCLTPAGAAAFADALARIEAHERQLMAGLTAAERTQLITLLGKIEAQRPA